MKQLKDFHNIFRHIKLKVRPGVSSGFSIFVGMKTFKVVAFLVTIILSQHALAQKITIYKTFGSVIYMQNDSIELSTKQVSMALFPYQDAYAVFKGARARATIASAFGFTGAAMIAIPVVTVAFGEKGDIGYAIAGTVFLGCSYFFNRSFKRRAVWAIDTYNQQIVQKTSRIKPEFYFYGTGAKLVIKF
ncbi:MAG TPA: hypothetical protein VGQ59_16175 [Cyclobacteriaceae bacterium]|jgi:hypothetical protein|nr:hypothetical protein [Cyclobacteriaceae bacterium]